MIHNEIIESFLNCKYKAYMEYNNQLGSKTEFELLNQDLLKSNKVKFYNNLCVKFSKDQIIEDFKFDKKRNIKNISYAIEPTLQTEGFNISFDAFEICPLNNSSGKISYIPIVISPKEKISKIENLSMCIKCVILSQLFGTNYEFGKIVYGHDLKIAKFKLEPFLTEAKRILTELHKLSNGESQPLIFQKSHCKICEFQETCKKELVEKDSLGLLHRMGEKDIRRHNNKGIFTVKQLSYTFRPRKRNRRVKTKNHPYYLSLQALAIREQKVYLYDKIDMPTAKTKIFIDMEGNEDGRFIYLIGVLVVQDDQKKMYSLWANNSSDERDIFSKLVTILSEYSEGHIFYFGKYESKVFKRLLKFDLSSEIEDLILNKSINILDVTVKSLYLCQIPKKYANNVIFSLTLL